MELDFTAPIWFWKGPAPWHFITVPEDDGFAIEATVAMVIRLGDDPGDRLDWRHSVDDVAVPEGRDVRRPVKTDFRRVEGLEVGDVVQISLTAEV